MNENADLNLRSPKLAIFLISLPLIILTAGIWYTLMPIITRLSQTNIINWIIFSAAQMVLCLSAVIFSVRSLLLKRMNHPLFYPVIFALETGLLYYFFAGYNDFINLNISSWMMGPGFIIFIISFIVPVMMFTLVNVADYSFSILIKKYWFVDLGLIVGIPLLVYLTSILLRNADISGSILVHIVIVFFVIAAILFFMVIVRFVLFITSKIRGKLISLSFVWNIVFGLLMPVAGLLLNGGIFGQLSDYELNIFGNFSNPLFYILAVVNGFALILSPVNGKLLLSINLTQTAEKVIRYVTLSVKALCLPFVVYFFVVFLPFIPFSIFALFLFGLGFFMIAPSILFLIEIISVLSDIRFLKVNGKFVPVIITILGVMIIPCVTTYTFYREKNNLKAALDYVYSEKTDGRIDTGLLTGTLSNVKRIQSNSGGFNIFGDRVPYIDGFYSNIVTQNLTLKKDKIGTLLNTFSPVFDPKYNYDSNFAEIHNSNIELSRSSVKTVFDDKKGLFRSEVDLDFTSTSESGGEEMISDFVLPETAFVGGYYLYVGDERKEGMLTEKRAAMWIYEMIKNENRDPGFLRYIHKNTLRFKIFPFNVGEVRKSGFTVYHTAPFTLSFYGKSLAMGNGKDDKNVVKSRLYIDPAGSDFKRVKRVPELNIILDCSIHSAGKTADYITAVDSINSLYPELKNISRKFYLANYRMTETARDKLQMDLINFREEGGFVVTQAVRSIIKRYINSYRSYPVILIISGSPDKFVISEELSDFAGYVPELQGLYCLAADGLHSYSLRNGGSVPVKDFNGALDMDAAVYSFDGMDNFFDYRNGGTFIKTLAESEIREKLKSDVPSESIIAMRMLENYNFLNRRSAIDKELFKTSIKQNVLSDATSFIVLEDRAQEEILKRKQKEFLNKDEVFDSIEEESGVEMAEPGTIIAVIGALLVIAVLFFRSTRKKVKDLY